MIGAIVQARMSSLRLPAKVMKPLPFGSNLLLIDQIIGALLSMQLISKVIVATTVDGADDVLCDHLEAKYGRQIKLYRGSEKDVLGRYYFAAKENNLQTIFRFTADNPFIDAELVYCAYKQYKKNDRDYLTTEGYPLGMNVELFNFSTLETAQKQAMLPYDREHVTSYISNHHNIFNIETLMTSEYEDISEVRLTVDSEMDYILMCCIFDYFEQYKLYFSLPVIRVLYHLKPWLFNINRNIPQKRRYIDKKEDVLHAIALIENLDMPNALNILKNAINAPMDLIEVN